VQPIMTFTQQGRSLPDWRKRLWQSTQDKNRSFVDTLRIGSPAPIPQLFDKLELCSGDGSAMTPVDQGQSLKW